MAKKSKKSVVWICVDSRYEIHAQKPKWDGACWRGDWRKVFCINEFPRLFPFFAMPPKSLGKITNTANSLTFEIVETRS